MSRHVAELLFAALLLLISNSSVTAQSLNQYSLQISPDVGLGPITPNALTCVRIDTPLNGVDIETQLTLIFENISFRGLSSCTSGNPYEILEATYANNQITLATVPPSPTSTTISCCLLTPPTPWYDATVSLYSSDNTSSASIFAAQANIPSLSLPLALRPALTVRIASIDSSLPQTLTPIFTNMILSQIARGLPPPWDWNEVRWRMSVADQQTIDGTIHLTVVFAAPMPPIRELVTTATHAQRLLAEVGIRASISAPSFKLRPLACDGICGGDCGLCVRADACAVDGDCFAGECRNNVCVMRNSGTWFRPDVNVMWVFVAVSMLSICGMFMC